MSIVLFHPWMSGAWATKKTSSFSVTSTSSLTATGERFRSTSGSFAGSSSFSANNTLATTTSFWASSNSNLSVVAAPVVWATLDGLSTDSEFSLIPSILTRNSVSIFSFGGLTTLPAVKYSSGAFLSGTSSLAATPHLDKRTSVSFSSSSSMIIAGKRSRSTTINLDAGSNWDAGSSLQSNMWTTLSSTSSFSSGALITIPTAISFASMATMELEAVSTLTSDMAVASISNGEFGNRLNSTTSLSWSTANAMEVETYTSLTTTISFTTTVGIQIWDTPLLVSSFKPASNSGMVADPVLKINGLFSVESVSGMNVTSKVNLENSWDAVSTSALSIGIPRTKLPSSFRTYTDTGITFTPALRLDREFLVSSQSSIVFTKTSISRESSANFNSSAGLLNTKTRVDAKTSITMGSSSSFSLGNKFLDKTALVVFGTSGFMIEPRLDSVASISFSSVSGFSVDSTVDNKAAITFSSTSSFIPEVKLYKSTAIGLAAESSWVSESTSLVNKAAISWTGSSDFTSWAFLEGESGLLVASTSGFVFGSSVAKSTFVTLQSTGNFEAAVRNTKLTDFNGVGSSNFELATINWKNAQINWDGRGHLIAGPITGYISSIQFNGSSTLGLQGTVRVTGSWSGIGRGTLFVNPALKTNTAAGPKATTVVAYKPTAALSEGVLLTSLNIIDPTRGPQKDETIRLFVGDSGVLNTYVSQSGSSNVPFDITNSQITFTAFNRRTSQVLITKSTSSGIDHVYPNQGQATIRLTPLETRILGKYGGELDFELHIFDEVERAEYFLDRGIIRLEPILV